MQALSIFMVNSFAFRNSRHVAAGTPILTTT
jgi:hypothetical protein